LRQFYFESAFRFFDVSSIAAKIGETYLALFSSELSLLIWSAQLCWHCGQDITNSIHGFNSSERHSIRQSRKV